MEERPDISFVIQAGYHREQEQFYFSVPAFGETRYGFGSQKEAREAAEQFVMQMMAKAMAFDGVIDKTNEILRELAETAARNKRQALWYGTVFGVCITLNTLGKPLIGTPILLAAMAFFLLPVKDLTLYDRFDIILVSQGKLATIGIGLMIGCMVPAVMAVFIPTPARVIDAGIVVIGLLIGVILIMISKKKHGLPSE